jgi:SAM-dependent methyltransferase
MHGFRHLPPRKFQKALSFGGANGEELRPIARQCQEIIIVEPATYDTTSLEGTPVSYRRPDASGRLPAADGEFDLLSSLGALHHIPNVSTVVKEFSRVLKPQGLALVREPIVSMGDWRHPRPRLTKRERGIPLEIFDRIVKDAGFEIVRKRRCVHAFTPRIGRALGINWFNSDLVTRVDATLSALTPWRTRYHPTRWFEKIQPSAIFYVLKKP